MVDLQHATDCFSRRVIIIFRIDGQDFDENIFPIDNLANAIGEGSSAIWSRQSINTFAPIDPHYGELQHSPIEMRNGFLLVLAGIFNFDMRRS